MFSTFAIQKTEEKLLEDARKRYQLIRDCLRYGVGELTECPIPSTVYQDAKNWTPEQALRNTVGNYFSTAELTEVVGVLMISLVKKGILTLEDATDILARGQGKPLATDSHPV